MADFRQTMMEKFRKMKARRGQNRKLDEEASSRSRKDERKKGEEGLSKRERKRKKEKEEKDDNAVSLRSRRDRRRKKDVDSKSKRVKKKPKMKPGEETSPQTPKKIKDIPVTETQKENFANFFLEMFGLGVDGIIQQYQTYLKTYVPENMTHTAFDKNMNRNRYKDVLCIDRTRVILQDRNPDYIHANHVRGEPFVSPFICTQGPLPVTVDDFWAMVIQEKVVNIVMLCNTIETGKNKCFQYWPQTAGSSLTFGDVQVKNTDVDENKDTTFVLSILEAERKGTRLVIKHMRWKNWPDKGVPSSCMAPFRILKIARQNLTRPTVVHCSAGIGRTGCIVAIEMGLQQLLSGKPLSIIPMVKQLRGMRMSSVQTDRQLVYVVRCLIAYGEVCGLFNWKPELQDKADKFINEYEALFAEQKPPAVAPPAQAPTPPTPVQPSPAAPSPVAPSPPSPTAPAPPAPAPAPPAPAPAPPAPAPAVPAPPSPPSPAAPVLAATIPTPAPVIPAPAIPAPAIPAPAIPAPAVPAPAVPAPAIPAPTATTPEQIAAPPVIPSLPEKPAAGVAVVANGNTKKKDGEGAAGVAAVPQVTEPNGQQQTPKQPEGQPAAKIQESSDMAGSVRGPEPSPQP